MAEPLKDLFQPSEMASILSAAILDKLTTDEKAALLQQAVAYLLEPQKTNSFDRGPGLSPVQGAVNVAAQSAVQRIAHQVIEDDPALQQQLRDLVTAAIQDAIAENSTFRDAVTRGVADTLRESSTRF